jgi:hypothetical protein
MNVARGRILDTSPKFRKSEAFYSENWNQKVSHTFSTAHRKLRVASPTKDGHKAPPITRSRI